jgi:hypothetical protein
MTRKRAHISLTEKLATVLAQWMSVEERASLRLAEAPARDVIARFEFHHMVPHALGGGDTWTNLCAVLSEDHTKITTGRKGEKKATSYGSTAHEVAKVKRLTKAQEDTRRALLKPAGHKRVKSARWPKRKFARKK